MSYAIIIIKHREEQEVAESEWNKSEPKCNAMEYGGIVSELPPDPDVPFRSPHQASSGACSPSEGADQTDSAKDLQSHTVLTNGV